MLGDPSKAMKKLGWKPKITAKELCKEMVFADYNLAKKNISIIKYSNVGYYGLQFFFSDGHKDGIYTFEFLKNLS